MEEATKRRPERSGEADLEEPQRKRARVVREVADLTLTLAAMVEMRGGGDPTAAEREMMAEARRKLAEVCGGFPPKEVFPLGEFGKVMEDLGLDQTRERKGLEFHPSAKLSIAEKVVYTKMKFEKAEANSLLAAKQSVHGLQTSTSGVAENASATKPAPVPSGILHPVSPAVHASATNPASLPYQLPASDVRKPVVSSGVLNSLPGKDSSASLSRVERPPFRMDQRSNGYISPMQGHARPALSQQSTSLAKPGAHNQVMPQYMVNPQGAIHMATSRMVSQAATPRPSITQTTSAFQPSMNPHVSRTNAGQNLLPSNTHSEISKIVHKYLQQYIPKSPAWNPPSRDYMNKSVTCQVCKLAIIDVEGVLVCDACENGYHMKCLSTQNLKTIPRGEWHCFKCSALIDGKSVPPKYGRVTRNTTTPKPAVLSSAQKKRGIPSDKANQPKLMANGSSGLQSSPASSLNASNSVSNVNTPDSRAMQKTDTSVSRHNTDEHVILKVATAPSASSSSVEISHEEKLGSELKGDAPPKPSETVTKVLDHVQSSSKTQDNGLKVSQCNDGIPSKQCHDNHLAAKKLDDCEIITSHDGNLNVDVKQNKKGVACLDLVESSKDGVNNFSRSSSDGSNFVDWIGDVAQVVDEKTYYSSCCINGNVYKVQDHVLFLCNDKQMPSKIQTMWEDNKTKLKWVIVNRSYFPGDLPKTVGHPCSLEGDEVYESNHGCAMLACLIQGPCEVLRPGKYLQECERRSRLRKEEKGGLRPIFQCKWFYDELKGSFRDLSTLP